jgi:Mg2+ and Co2+ transporter CorA
MNEEAAFKLEEAAEKFSEIAAVDGPTPHHRAEYATLKRSVINSLRALQNNPEMIHSLREEDNLFGSPKPRTALERYEVIHSSTESRLRQAEQFLTLTQEDWRITQEEHQNNILFRLAVLTGALSPTALATGIFGMNFPDGLPYSTPTMVLGIGASISISAILVGTLLFNRAFPRQGKFIQKS